MELIHKLKTIIPPIVSYLCVMLFLYAAVSKMLDYENFRVQFAQSPLLSAFAGYVAWGVPALEVLISIMLLSEKWRSVGLFASFGLMVMFTAYIHHTEFQCIRTLFLWRRIVKNDMESTPHL